MLHDEVSQKHFQGINRWKATQLSCSAAYPRYEVALKGQASKLDFYLDKTDLDFGEVPYTEVGKDMEMNDLSHRRLFGWAWYGRPWNIVF